MSLPDWLRRPLRITRDLPAVALLVWLTLTLGPGLAVLFWPPPPGALATIAYTGALLTAGASLLLLPRRHFSRRPASQLLVATLPALALVSLLVAVAGDRGGNDSTLSALLALQAIGGALNLGPLLALVLAARHHPTRRRRIDILLILTASALAGIALATTLGVLSDQALVSLTRFGQLAAPLFAAALLVVFLGLLPRHLAESPSSLGRALWLALLPQLLMLWPWSSPSLAAFQGMVLGGLLFWGALQRFRLPGETLRPMQRTSAVAVDPSGPPAELREAFERQRQTLLMLEKAVETMSQGVTITDMDGRILYVNPADARMHGYAVEELVGREARLFSSLSRSPPEGDAIERPWRRERLNATKDGRTIPVRLTSDRVHDRDQPVATVTICEDLEERETIREALARRDRILQAVGFAAEQFLSDLPWEECVEEVLERLGRATGVDLIYILRREEGKPFDPESVILAWGTPGGAVEASFKEDLGLPERDALFSRWRQRLASGETLHGRVANLPPAERQVLEPWGIRSFVVVPIFVRSMLRGYLSLEEGDEERIWSASELEALTAAARTFGASIAKSEAARELAESEEKYRELLESANDLIQSVSPDGRFLYVNHAWQRTLGYGAEEIQGLRVWDVVRPQPPEGNDENRDIVQAILTDDRLGPIEAIFVTKDGRELTVEGSVNCRYEDGLPVATRGIFRDITERKVVDRMIQEFISTVSHELRTPLTSIIASLGLLESGKLAKNPDRAKELVSIALRNSQRLLQLINNLLDLQKLSANKMTFNFEAIEVEGLLEEAVEDLRALAESCSIELRVSGISTGLQIHGDRNRLMQVLNNLLSNAIKFSPDNGIVRVSGRAEGQEVVLTVADDGPGIPEEFRSRLFDRFTQFDSSSTRRSGGSGLGLSIVKGLVEGMDGTVALDTEVEQGTTFHVHLPRVQVPILVR